MGCGDNGFRICIVIYFEGYKLYNMLNCPQNETRKILISKIEAPIWSSQMEPNWNHLNSVQSKIGKGLETRSNPIFPLTSIPHQNLGFPKNCKSGLHYWWPFTRARTWTFSPANRKKKKQRNDWKIKWYCQNHDVLLKSSESKILAIPLPNHQEKKKENPDFMP